MGKIQWFWSGALTAEEITIKARYKGSILQAKVRWGTSPKFTEEQTQETNALINKIGSILDCNLKGLQEDTEYFYQFIVDGDKFEKIGQFKTIKINKPYNFKVACGACA